MKLCDRCGSVNAVGPPVRLSCLLCAAPLALSGSVRLPLHFERICGQEGNYWTPPRNPET